MSWVMIKPWYRLRCPKCKHVHEVPSSIDPRSVPCPNCHAEWIKANVPLMIEVTEEKEKENAG
jgi:hypothetical protein